MYFEVCGFAVHGLRYSVKMSAIDSYGDFELPEEKATIEVVEDPVKVILASYDVFKKLVKIQEKNDWEWWAYSAILDQVYQEALKVFAEKQELSADAKQLAKIIEELSKKAKNTDGTGVFLSALMNSTKIKTLFIVGFPSLDQIGYQLKKDKTVILGSGATSYVLGGCAEGNTINLGTVLNDQGYLASDGNHVNQGNLVVDQGFKAKGGNYIDQGFTKYQGYLSSGGNLISLKFTDILQSDRVIDLTEKSISDELLNLFGRKSKKALLKIELEQKLGELDFLKEPKKIIELIDTFDWNKFHFELNEICKKIRKAYGK